MRIRLNQCPPLTFEEMDFDQNGFVTINLDSAKFAKPTHRLVKGSFIGLTPANKPRQAILKLVQLGNAINSTPSTALTGNHHSKCNTDTPNTSINAMPRANSMVEANIGGETTPP